jgi:hypothetical protein
MKSIAERIVEHWRLRISQLGTKLELAKYIETDQGNQYIEILRNQCCANILFSWGGTPTDLDIFNPRIVILHASHKNDARIAW